MKTRHAAGVRLECWRERASPPGAPPLSIGKAAKLAEVTRKAWFDWERRGVIATIPATIQLRRITGGLVQAEDFVRLPAPEDYDLNADVSYLRARVTQQPAGAA